MFETEKKPKKENWRKFTPKVHLDWTNFLDEQVFQLTLENRFLKSKIAFFEGNTLRGMNIKIKNLSEQVKKLNRR